MSDSTPAGQVGVACPSCSPEGPLPHEILAEGGGYATVRCTNCRHVHKIQLPDAKPVERRVIVSQHGESFTASVEAPRGETIERGEEFVLDTDEAIMEVRITDLQVGAEERVPRATVEEVDTVWTRAVDNVSVNVTVNPGGQDDESRGITVQVPGDHEFVVGETATVDGDAVTVRHLRLRPDARGYDFEQLDKDGDRAPAKDVKRVYAVADSADDWTSPW